MCDRLGVRGAAERVLAGLLPPADGCIDIARLREVQGHHFGIGLGVACEVIAHHACDPLMILLSPALEQ